MPIPDHSDLYGVRMYEIASVSERAEAFLTESSAIFGLILTVLLLIFLQLMQPMRKLTSILVWTASVLNKLLAKL